MTRPSFFIVGAPKSGTTALHEYLSNHPRICMSSPKEPHYFNEDMPGFRWAQSSAEYESFFGHATAHHLSIGEASPLYLYSETAAQRIKAYDPNARVIVMLRRYVDYLRSYHNHTVYNRDEDEPDFEKAWELQTERSRGELIPPTCREPKLLQYKEVGSLGRQLERVFAVFPSDQVQVIFFDDFISNTADSYEAVLRFLGVPSDGRTEFPRVNEAKAHRSMLLANVLQRPPEPLLRLGRRLKPLIGSAGRAAYGLLRELNTEREVKKPQIGDEFKSRLAATFEEDAQLLSRLTGRDVSDWARG